MTLNEYKELVLASFLKTLVVTELEFLNIVSDNNGSITLLKSEKELNKYQRTLLNSLKKLNKYQVNMFLRNDFNKAIMDNTYNLLFKGIENSKAWKKYSPMEVFTQLVLLYNGSDITPKNLPITNGKFLVRIMFYVNEFLKDKPEIKENSKRIGNMIWHNLGGIK